MQEEADTWRIKASWRCVRRYKCQTQFCSFPLWAALLDGILICAGQSRQEVNNLQQDLQLSIHGESEASFHEAVLFLLSLEQAVYCSNSNPAEPH